MGGKPMWMTARRQVQKVLMMALVAGLQGCAAVGWVDRAPEAAGGRATLAPISESYRDLISLPPPKGKIAAAVFGFRDQTGQYKQSPASSFSTAVTQGAASVLVKAMLDSNWFIPVEREGLNNLLTERKIIRAATQQQQQPDDLPPLMSASVLIEGGIVGYETNVRTGGAGMRYLGIGASDQYRMDQVTVNLRAVDIRSGRVLNSVTTTKTIFSVQVDLGAFRFVRFKRLLELEAGHSYNEPAQLCVTDAIEAALAHLIVQGITTNTWRLANPDDLASPVLKPYLEGLSAQQLAAQRASPTGDEPRQTP